jgi:hypothetical protein
MLWGGPEFLPGEPDPIGSRLADAQGGWSCRGFEKKQGATGITTIAPYVAGQWGRGNNRLPGLL